MEGSPLLPEGTELPAQNLEGVMRSLDMVEKALGEALLMAEAMPGPDESAIGARQHLHAANRSQNVVWHLGTAELTWFALIFWFQLRSDVTVRFSNG